MTQACLEFFLTHQVRNPEVGQPSYKGHWVLDSESIHNDILQILLSNSQDFMISLFKSKGTCSRPSSKFDMQVLLETGVRVCIEIKVWGAWSAMQKDSQITKIRQYNPAIGCAFLFGNSAAWSRKAVVEQTQGVFQKLTYSDLYPALDSVNGEAGLVNLAMAYKAGLKAQESRLGEQYQWSPND